MASFTTRERLIKLYSEHGYISPNPKKFVPAKKKKARKKILRRGQNLYWIKKQIKLQFAIIQKNKRTPPTN